ncbi:DUF1566 domain-containing protein [Xylella taiwanensis]|nr:DUF1566 domain-containing protein [Xylella taiwanensis]QKD98111.1 DUF1566 domain-containing protein [Xylella taiwanensis]
MPTLEARASIRDRSRYAPAIDTDAFPDTPSECFWTFTHEADPKNNDDPHNGSCSVEFRDDGSCVRYNGATNDVRAVRDPNAAVKAGVSWIAVTATRVCSHVNPLKKTGGSVSMSRSNTSWATQKGSQRPMHGSQADCPQCTTTCLKPQWSIWIPCPQID